MTRSHLSVRRPEVLAALLGDSAEAALVRRSDDGALRLRRHGRRATLLARLRLARPDLLIVPLADTRRVPTVPLIALCRSEFPEMSVLVLSAGTPSRGSALLEAVRMGAAVLVAPDAQELRAEIRRCVTEPPVAPGWPLFHQVQPGLLRELLNAAWQVAESHGGVAQFAAACGLSPRSLRRHTSNAGLGPPSRVLRAVYDLRPRLRELLAHHAASPGAELRVAAPQVDELVAALVRGLGGAFPPSA